MLKKSLLYGTVGPPFDTDIPCYIAGLSPVQLPANLAEKAISDSPASYERLSDWLLIKHIFHLSHKSVCFGLVLVLL